jgi:hypothetical protein
MFEKLDEVLQEFDDLARWVHPELLDGEDAARLTSPPGPGT